MYRTRGGTLTDDERRITREQQFEEQCRRMLDYVDGLENPIYKSDLDKWAEAQLKLKGDKRQAVFNSLVNRDLLKAAGERKPGGRKLVWTSKKMTQFLHDNAAKYTFE